MIDNILPIHTLNARGNVFLDVVKAHRGLGPPQMLCEIQAMRREVEEILATKFIRYEDLRGALVPSQKRQEVSLVFDSAAIPSGNYGRIVFENIMPLLDAKGSHSVLVGDYGTFNSADEPLLAEAFRDAVKLARPIIYRNSGQFFIVYINNLTPAMVARLDTGLRPFVGYVGIADMTYGSIFKFLLSTMLANVFLKHGRTIILGHEDDRSNDEDCNMVAWPFECFGYTVRSLVSYLQGPFLTYKIERPVLGVSDSDTEMSLNAISDMPLPLSDFAIQVESAKAAYVRRHNAPALARAGLEAIDSERLSALIGAKIKESYIYRLEYVAEHATMKFNIIIEVPGKSRASAVRFLAALEYRPQDKQLRLITLF